VQLLDPPFDSSSLNPGYIRGYVPGVRENGGQYTHAAVWATMAFAELGDSARAWELFRMINPVNHALTAEAAAIYKVEPYVVAADVYAVAPNTGRGGWSWYTGSAGWMYRLLVESLLGLRREGESLRLAPCLPADWPSIKITYRYRETFYHIAVSAGSAGSAGSTGSHAAGGAGENASNRASATAIQPPASAAGVVVDRVSVDGREQPDQRIPLVDDRQAHQVVVEIHRQAGHPRDSA